MQATSSVSSSSTVTSTVTTTPPITTRHSDSSKPGLGTPRLASPRQDSKTGFDSPLRMHDFYGADPVFKQLAAALKANGATADTKTLLNDFAFQMESIRKSVLDAEKLFTPYSRKECALRLEAAKANQVRLLGKIDTAPDDVLSARKRDEIRNACAELGRSLSKMLVQAKALEKARSADQISLPRSQQKRAQSHPDSPVLKGTSPKRIKVDSPPPRSPNAFSSPCYKPAPALVNDSTPSSDAANSNSANPATATTSATSATSATSSTSTTTSSTAPTTSCTSPAPATSTASATSTVLPVANQVSQSPVTSPNSPASRKRHRLAAQPKPRPASQLFTAPPDFGTQAKATPLPVVSAIGNLHTKQADPHLGAPSPDAQ